MYKKAPSIVLLGFVFLIIITPSTNGWYEKMHSLAAKVAIRFIEESERGVNPPLYKELYQFKFNREIGRGAWREDWDPPIDGNDRALRHFYDPDGSGPAKGLQFQSYFYAWGPILDGEVTKPGSGYYKSALEWARDGAGSSSPFHWKGAIEAYDYTESSPFGSLLQTGPRCPSAQ